MNREVKEFDKNIKRAREVETKLRELKKRNRKLQYQINEIVDATVSNYYEKTTQSLLARVDLCTMDTLIRDPNTMDRFKRKLKKSQTDTFQRFVIDSNDTNSLYSVSFEKSEADLLMFDSYNTLQVLYEIEEYFNDGYKQSLINVADEIDLTLFSYDLLTFDNKKIKAMLDKQVSNLILEKNIRVNYVNKLWTDY